MKGEHYTVHRDRAYFGILSAIFPVQTKSTPSIIVWSLILLLDLTAGVLGAYYSGVLQEETASKTTIIILIAGIIAVFWLQGTIWGLITKLFSKRKDKCYGDTRGGFHMKKESTGRTGLRKYFNIMAKANMFHLFGPKSWAPQTDYNPLQPGSDKPAGIDMRPKAVEAREKEARRSLIMPAVLVAGIPVLFVVIYLIKVNQV